jgi:phage tail-like protein
VKEGGENSFEHKLPIRTKSTDLVLKRGLLTNSEVIQWCRDAFENMIFQPTDVLVKLLNEKGEPLRTWNVVHAWPRKWTISDFSSTDNAVVVETLELSYHYFKII